VKITIFPFSLTRPNKKRIDEKEELYKFINLGTLATQEESQSYFISNDKILYIYMCVCVCFLHRPINIMMKEQMD